MADDDAGTREAGDDGEVSAFKSFYTPSQLLSTMNDSLKATMPVRPGGTQPSVTLQRKLENGQTVPATKGELGMNDAKAKIGQAAAIVSTMETYAEKARWRDKQRIAANETFAVGTDEAVKEAMDLYLTCLVVDDKENVGCEGVNAEGRPRILQNLVICAVKLRQYKQTLEFGTLLLNDLPPTTTDQALLAIKIKTLVNCGSAHSRLGAWSEAKKLLGEAVAEVEMVEDERKQIMFANSINAELSRLKKNKTDERVSEKKMATSMRENFAKTTSSSLKTPHMKQRRTHSSLARGRQRGGLRRHSQRPTRQTRSGKLLFS